MNREKLKRFGWLVYLSIILTAIILFLLAIFVVTTGDFHSLLLGLTTNFLGAGLIFFFVKQFALYKPEEEEVEQNLNLIEQVRETLKTVEKNNFIIYPSRTAMYNYERELLNSRQWEKVRVFAPVELWKDMKDKRNNFLSISDSVKNKKIKSSYSVFGLPPKTYDGKDRERSDIVVDLAYFEEMILLFDEAETEVMHYLPPSDYSIGFAVLIYEGSEGEGDVAFGFASRRSETVVETGFSTNDKQLFNMTKRWFDETIFYKNTIAFVLKDEKETFQKQWPIILEAWYGKEYFQLLEIYKSHNQKTTK